MNNVIGHNNMGISYLRHQWYQKALMEFKKAAQLMYSITQELKKKPTIDETAPLQEVSIRCTVADLAIDNVFIRATPISMEYITEPVSSCMLESAIILMNMALCYHLDSLKPSCMPEATQNAITLYEMTYNLGLQINDDPRSYNLILTALNNLGQIFNDLGDYNKSRTYFEDLTLYANFVGQQYEAETVRDRHELILNALVLRNPNTSAAAA